MGSAHAGDHLRFLPHASRSLAIFLVAKVLGAGAFTTAALATGAALGAGLATGAGFFTGAGLGVGAGFTGTVAGAGDATGAAGAARVAPNLAGIGGTAVASPNKNLKSVLSTTPSSMKSTLRSLRGVPSCAFWVSPCKT